MLISYKLGQGSVLLRVKIPDSTQHDNSGVTGLTSATSGLNISVAADNEASSTIYTGSNIEGITTLGTYAAPTSSKCRFKEFDATNHPGVYELQIADARFSVSSAKSLLITILAITASDAAQVDILIPLTTFDPYAINDVRLADGVAHGGIPGSSTASLALQSIHVENPSGVATTFWSTGSDGSGLSLAGNGAGFGLDISGGNTSESAVSIFSSSGHGVAIQANETGSAIYAKANDTGAGITIIGAIGVDIFTQGDGSGVRIQAGGEHPGLEIIGGDTSGPAILLMTFDGNCIDIIPTGINVHGINIAGGDTSGNAINLTVTSGSGINGTLSPTLLSSFFLIDSGQEYSDAIAGSVVKEIADSASGSSPSDIATAVWQDATSGDFTVSGSIGKSLFTGGVVPGGTNGLFIAGTNAATTVTTSFTTTFTGNLTGSIGDITATALSKFFLTNSTTTFASAVAGSVVKEIVDNAGGLTAAAIATAVWQDATSGDFTVSGSIGKSLFTGGVVPGGTNGLFIAGTNAATTITTSLTTHLIGTVDTVTTVTNQLSAAAIATAVWQDATSGDFTVSGSIGKSLFTSGNAPGTSGGHGLHGGIVVVNSYSSGQDPATLVLGATASSFNTALTIGSKINAAASAGDPWTTLLPGSYTVGTAGYIIGNFAVSTVSIGNPIAF